MNGLGISAVLTADSAFQIGFNGPAFDQGGFHQLSHTFPVDGCKGIVRQNACFQIMDQKTGFSVIP